ncbi:hypothetical protein ACHWP0_07680 [Weissella cibaria]|uniref:hypothetical protein n=1 Tax=Weissella cibaria TaxID=137591 RepID=UPI00376EE9FE
MMMDSMGTIIQTDNMIFINAAKQERIKNEFEALNKSMEEYFTEASKMSGSSKNVDQTKLRLVGLKDNNDKVVVTGVLQHIESRAINNSLFQDHSKETICSTRQLKRMVENLSIYLETSNLTMLDETLDSAQMTAEILSNKLDRIERRASKSERIEIELGSLLIGMPKSTTSGATSSGYNYFFSKGSIGKKENNIKSFLKAW